MSVFRIKKIIQIGIVASLVVLLGSTADFAQKDDLFDRVGKALASPTPAKKNGQDDPFSPENELKESPQTAAGSVAASKAAVTRTNASPIDKLIEFQTSIEPGRARRGQTVTLKIRGTPASGYHTYPLTKRSADPAHTEGLAPKWTYESLSGLQPLWPVTETEPTFEKDGSKWFLEHKSPFTWSQDILVLPDAQPGKKTLPFTIKLQVCDEKRCTPGDAKFEARFEVSNEPAIALEPALEKRLQLRQPDIEVVPYPGMQTVSAPNINRAEGAAADAGSGSPANGSQGGLWAFILQGIFWGAVSLITPCVFPMLPITVSFFLKQSEKQHHSPLVLASVYSGTIVVVLTLGGLLLMRILQPISQNWITQLVLGGLFAFFALSLFGMFEIRLPSGFANFTSAQEGRGGLVGTMFMALTFTIISFTCVAPFYGSFIAFVASAQSFGEWLKLVLGALAFSATFASPFFVLALFPTLLHSMPKSGTWMNTVKVVMGFLELAAALKFLRAGELTWLNGKAQILTHDLVLGGYVALALLCGLYLLNLYRLPHDQTPVEHLGVPRLLFSLAFLSLAFYLTPSLFRSSNGEKQRPTGKVFAWVDSFLLTSRFEDSTHDLAWVGNLTKGLNKASAENRLVFVDFTGFN
jgi:thiol:disulfide interchange protein DsbD